MPKHGKKNNLVLKTHSDTTEIIVVPIGSKNKIKLSKYTLWCFFILFCTIIACILLFPYPSNVRSFNLPKEGTVSEETVIAPLTFDIIKTREEIMQERELAIRHVLLLFDRDIQKEKLVRKKFQNLSLDIYKLTESSTTDLKISEIMSKLKTELSGNTLKTLVDRPYLLDDVIFQAQQMLQTGVLSVLLIPSEKKLDDMKEEYNKEFVSHIIYNKEYILLRQDSTENAVEYSKLYVKETAIENIINTLKVERLFDQEALSSIYELLDVYLLPNLLHNGEETEKRRQAASRAVLAKKGTVLKGTEIVRKHQKVTADIVEKLRSLHIAIASKEHGKETRRMLRLNAGKIALIILFIILLGYYTVKFHIEFFKKPKHITALSCILILQFVIIRIGLMVVPRLFETEGEINAVTPEYLIPTAVASILVTLLFNFRLSIYVTLFISFYFSMVLSFNYSLFLYSFLGGFIAGLSTRKIRYRWDFFKAIPRIAFIYVIFISIWNLISYNLSMMILVQDIGLGIINCIITIFLSMMFVALFENYFDITTDMTLIELSDMNHPLLKRLSIEASGTYNHSILVANLAESAAEGIGANTLLARIGSYYHDIGKLAKPNYFVENQKIEKNIHDKLAPSMSALVISSHVKEGLALAKKFKLPSVIKDSIAQHHGTCEVSFFYEKALERDQHKQLDKKDFCYPGPRPLTKENAIIMLADSVEAASRTLSAFSPKALREMVKKIIQNKFSSSQLDECNLTFRDLDKIIKGFMPVLEGIFHVRVEYPEKKQENNNAETKV